LLYTRFFRLHVACLLGVVLYGLFFIIEEDHFIWCKMLCRKIFLEVIRFLRSKNCVSLVSDRMLYFSFI